MPVTINDIIQLQVSQEDIYTAIAKAKEQFFIDNLRIRHPNVSFDSKLRGYVGEAALKNWFKQFSIELSATNYMYEDGSMDVDFLFIKNSKHIEIELKTSLIPDKDATLRNTIHNRDIKLIRRNRDTIENLKGDIHIQVFFKQLRKAKDKWLQQQTIDIENSTTEQLYKSFGAYRYLTDTFLAGWIDKSTLLALINVKPDYKRTWNYQMRVFWNCSLRTEAKPAKDLISYLEQC